MDHGEVESPNLNRSRILHRFFELGILIKGIDGGLELVGGLAANKLWSYPAAIAVFAAFTVYQLYQLAHQYSLFLGLVTVLDIVVILLVTEEYTQMRMARRDVRI